MPFSCSDGIARRGCGSRRRRDRVVLLAPFLVHDEPAVPLRSQNGIGRVELHIDRVVVDLDELGVGRNVGQEVGALGAHAVGGKDHVVGGEGVAVVEFDALAQMEAPAGRLRGFPAFGQRRNDLQILVAGDQALIDMRMMGDGRGFLERIGIERFELALVGVAQGLARCRRHGKSGDRERWSLQARSDVPTFVDALRGGALFSSAISTAMTDPCCQSLAAAQARFPRRKPVCATCRNN